MAFAHSRLTSQGQISVPAEVRKKLGVGPGSVLEWDEANGQIVVRKVARFDFADIHEAVFAKPPARKSLADLKEGVRSHAKRRHGRR